MRKYGMTKSGVYQIDPDGPFDKSEMPIKAYCDFDAGTTTTLSNSPLTNEASPSQEPLRSDMI